MPKQYPDTVTSPQAQKRVYTKRKAPETRLIPFSRAYNKLSNDDKNIAREIIMKRGKIPYIQNFNNMKLGRATINIERQDIIVSVFKAMGLDAWTGEPFFSEEN